MNVVASIVFGEIEIISQRSTERPTVRRFLEETLQHYAMEIAAVDLRQFVTDDPQRINDVADEPARSRGGNCKFFSLQSTVLSPGYGHARDNRRF